MYRVSTREPRGIWLAVAACLVIAAAWTLVPHPAVGLALAFLPIAALTVLRLPFHVALGFGIFSFFRIHEAFPVLEPFRIPQLLALTTLSVLGWHLTVSRAIRPLFPENRKRVCYSVP